MKPKKIINLEIPNAFAETLKETLASIHSTQRHIATLIHVPPQHLSEMQRGIRRCTVDMDLRLSRFFGTSEGFWLRLQTAYDLRLAKAANGKKIEEQIMPYVFHES